MAIIKILGSLAFAVFLIGALAFVLIVSTSLESAYGTPLAQKFIYEAGWFDVFLGLLAVNIVCSTISRFPFKKRHTGFIITHVGILLLLAGSFLGRRMGVEGQMALYEGESRREILLKTYELVVHSHDGSLARLDLASYAGARRDAPLDKLRGASAGRFQVALRRVWENAVETTDVSEGPAGGPPNPAIGLTLKSEMAGFEEPFWLVENNPWDASSKRLSVGPAVIELGKKRGEREGAAAADISPRLRIVQNDSKKEFTINLENISKEDVPLGASGLAVSGIKYYPDARVEKNELTSISAEPRNPAVVFDIHDAKGRREHFVKFALFPEFESMHHRVSGNLFGLAVQFISPPSELKQKAGLATLIFHPGAPRWTYETKTSKASIGGEIESGKTYPAGWMDFSFRINALFDRAVVSKRVRRALEAEKGRVGAEVSLAYDGKPLFKGWVLEDNAREVLTPDGEVVLAVSPKKAKIPFSLALKDFRKIDYPGTDRAASYESDVVLHDPRENLTLEKTIRMNKPLDYRGYRVFQSSYIQDPAAGEASVFTIARNPGVGLIYSGAVILFTGIGLVFFVTPFSSMKN